MTKWTDKRTDRLKQMWAEGLSVEEIVAILGKGLNPSGVVGKAYRLKLPSRAKPRTKSNRAVRQEPSLLSVLRSYLLERDFERG